MVAKKYKVTLNANGGKFENGKKTASFQVVAKEKIKRKDLVKPSRKGYQFNGWYTKKSGGTQIKPGYVVKKDMTLYARWARTGVMTGKAFLRKAPNGKILGTAKQGETVEILQVEKYWCKIRCKAGTGWVFREFLRLPKTK